ncbi:spidroin-1-like [Cyclospora cayetanensis]|uniref:Spidroin-1-like n=1 Tax=Cyclospora cayetanensis TaxID=88456 RepID=A0A6P6RYB5_9EIME|nr:spidroin-1-like [Cyclospora cayetanensis]
MISRGEAALGSKVPLATPASSADAAARAPASADTAEKAALAALPPHWLPWPWLLQQHPDACVAAVLTAQGFGAVWGGIKADGPLGRTKTLRRGLTLLATASAAAAAIFLVILRHARQTSDLTQAAAGEGGYLTAAGAAAAGEGGYLTAAGGDLTGAALGNDLTAGAAALGGDLTAGAAARAGDWVFQDSVAGGFVDEATGAIKAWLYRFAVSPYASVAVLCVLLAAAVGSGCTILSTLCLCFEEPELSGGTRRALLARGFLLGQRRPAAAGAGGGPPSPRFEGEGAPQSLAARGASAAAARHGSIPETAAAPLPTPRFSWIAVRPFVLLVAAEAAAREPLRAEAEAEGPFETPSEARGRGDASEGAQRAAARTSQGMAAEGRAPPRAGGEGEAAAAAVATAAARCTSSRRAACRAACWRAAADAAARLLLA